MNTISSSFLCHSSFVRSFFPPSSVFCSYSFPNTYICSNFHSFDLTHSHHFIFPIKRKKLFLPLHLCLDVNKKFYIKHRVSDENQMSKIERMKIRTNIGIRKRVGTKD